MILGGRLQLFDPSCHVAVPGDPLSRCQLLEFQEKSEIVATRSEKHEKL
jgi:hypothetical protein